MLTDKQQELYDFFFYKSTNSIKRFKGLNFLCAKTDEQLNKSVFSKKLIKWLGQKNEILDKFQVLNDYYSFQNDFNNGNKEDDKKGLTKDYISKIINANNEISQDLTEEWTKLVENIHKAYFVYLEKLFEKSDDIKYVIISEASMLTLKKETNKLTFDCRYIFSDNHENIGSYRKAPYFAICDKNSKKSEEPKAKELIQLFVKKRVLFLDLIPLPLPKIYSELRKNWSTNKDFEIDDVPRVITFLRCSLNYIFEKYEKINFKKNVQIALMMPSNSALGIINFYLNPKPNYIEPFQGKITNISKIITRRNSNKHAKKLQSFSLRLHRQVAMGSQGYPETELLKHALSK